MKTLQTKHKDNCSRVFKNYDKTCNRCIELINGAPARKGWQTAYFASKRLKDEMRNKAIMNHNCNISHCGPICVAFDW